MNLSVGIVGLPNVGKSTLFNALLKKQQALAANYPFATIEPNVGVVPVPDSRLEVLADIVAAEESPSPQGSGSSGRPVRPPLRPATVNFIDIAGLVKGASEGAGLGNKFLSHVREVSVIAHVVRAFSDENVIREGSVDPKSDFETIETELMLADLQSVEKAISNKKSEISKVTLEKVREGLNTGIPVRDVKFTPEEAEEVRQLFLISAKPEIIVLNVSEADYPKFVTASIEKQSNPEIASLTSFPRNDNSVFISAQIESELAALSEEEQKQYLADLGLSTSGLERLIQKAYEQLGLISFLTAGEKEVRAWTIEKGTDAQSSAGTIHNDFIKHFIKAEVVSFEDFVSCKGWKGSREAGKARMEGKEYIVRDGDVIEFKIGN